MWDADLIPLRPWRICDYDDLGRPIYYFAILQSEARSEFNKNQYGACMMALTDMESAEPLDGGTFVAHHMVLNKERVIEMFELMKKTTRSNLPFPLLIMSYSRLFFRFSEYMTYASFLSNYHPEELHYYPLPNYGDGIRIRSPKPFIKKLLQRVENSFEGISYDDIYCYFSETTEKNQNEKVLHAIPSYIQVEHVYGISEEQIREYDTMDSLI